MALRPRCTSSATSQEAGATWLYQGQTVEFEWQSLHERFRIPATSGVTGATACMLCPGCSGGFVRGGRTICAARIATPANARDAFIHVGIRNPPGNLLLDAPNRLQMDLAELCLECIAMARLVLADLS